MPNKYQRPINLAGFSTKELNETLDGKQGLDNIDCMQRYNPHSRLLFADNLRMVFRPSKCAVKVTRLTLISVIARQVAEDENVTALEEVILYVAQV